MSVIFYFFIFFLPSFPSLLYLSFALFYDSLLAGAGVIVGKGAGSPAWHRAIGKLGTTIYGQAGCHTCMHFFTLFFT